ncbi:MAG: [protein-PII] uridylyltransferase [Acidiferrobacteraceae bacterium]
MALKKSELFDSRNFSELLAKADTPLSAFRSALQRGREILKQAYLAGERADRVVETTAWLVDQLLVRAWEQHLPLLGDSDSVSLVAVGGYGRGELHPASDIDIMLLSAKPLRGKPEAFLETFLRFLWDMGLEVGHSVRSLKDCVREARKDITVATNLMETRLLHGDPELLQKMQAATGPAKLWRSRKFFEAKWQEQIARHHRFHDTAYNLEPNIKEGPGGLRDIQMISWVTQREFGTRSLHDLVQHGFLTEAEYRSLIKGRNYLWHIRCGLHYLAGRREDRLLFDQQRLLAEQDGYKPKKGSLAVEQFMKDYYRTIKELSLLNEILLQHFQETILTKGKVSVLPVNRRFRLRGGFVETTSPRVFERTPYAMLELFLVIEQHPRAKGVRADTIRQLRSNIGRIDDQFRDNIVCRSLFMEILRQKSGITDALRRMNAYGVLGAYLPVFGRIVGQMQHDLFHVYTVDEHTLFVLRNVRRFMIPERGHEFPLASAISKRLVKPERLYVAALFHDIAKGRGGDHSVLGEKEVQRFCVKHDLSDYDTRFISWLVHHHLLMSAVAQRQDIHDPEVVQAFARQVGDQEHLDNLYLLTVADIRGTSPGVWNDWKGNLLAQLYLAATRLLRRGFGTPIDIDAHIRDVKDEVLRLLKDTKTSRKQVEGFWSQMENDYFLRHDTENLAWHAQVIADARITEMPVVAMRYDTDLGGTVALVFAQNREGLFSAITGSLDELGLSVVDARMHTARTGFVLDVFVLLDHEGKPVREARLLREIRRNLHADLVQGETISTTGARRVSRQLQHFPVESRILFSPSSNGQQTIIDVTTQDRPGLLHQITLALLDCKVRLVGAKVATYGERAEDVFFVTDRDGKPLVEENLLQELRHAIEVRLDQ